MYPNDNPSFLDCKWGNDNTVTWNAADAFLSLSSWPGAGDSVTSFPVLVGWATGDGTLAFLGLGLGFLSALSLRGVTLPGPLFSVLQWRDHQAESLGQCEWGTDLSQPLWATRCCGS